MKQKAELAGQILHNSRNALYAIFPHLDAAFASLPYRLDGDLPGIGTDGVSFFAEPQALIRDFAASPARVRRNYLHLLLHCLYLHPFTPPETYDRAKWDLSCDLAVEQIIEREQIPELALPSDPVRTACLTALGSEVRSAEQIYTMLDLLPGTNSQLAAAFGADNHEYWRKCAAGDPKTRARWAGIQAYTGQNRHGNRRGSVAGEETEIVEAEADSGYDYRKFLQRFAVPREELELDPESFDYIYYSFGMEHYGNLPLIEWLEYREVNRLEELVIAIDTSGSCSKELVARFLEETFAILNRRENFFSRMKVYLIQCDCVLHSVTVIHSAEEWNRYSREITIHGRAGTDFTPVFRYVEKLREEKELKNLRALIYFTDGDGVYPREPTDYETAFVFVEETDAMDYVPKWARKLSVGGRKKA